MSEVHCSSDEASSYSESTHVQMTGLGRLSTPSDTVPEPDAPPPPPPGALERMQTETALMPRHIHILEPNPHHTTSNLIITSKYTAITFLPYILFELLSPYRRLANFFYLVVGALQMVPAISPLTPPSPQAWSSLVFIVGIDMVLLGREDINRHRADDITNAQPVEIVSRAEDGTVSVRDAVWKDVKCGDVVRVRSKEAFPADLVLLRGSDPPGQCWVNTKPLDGESDMKLRLAPNHGLSPAESEGVNANAPIEQQLDWKKLCGTVACEAPNDKVNDFTGELYLDGQARPIILTPANMLLRGCMLMNTDWVFGLVVSCGTDTKINFGGGRLEGQKVGYGWQLLNKMIIYICLVILALCIVGASIAQIDLPGYEWYLFEGMGETDPKANWWITMMTYFLTLYTMVPATIFVSGNIIYMATSILIRDDLTMYHEENEERCQVRQMNLLDELGQVSHIFSDKTGTLTSNHMEFRRLLVEGTSYGCGDTAISRSLRDVKGGGALAPALTTKPVPSWAGCRAQTAAYVSFEQAADAPDLFDQLSADGAEAERRRELALNMAVNHSVLLDEQKELSASSPDEQAFVAAAEYFGFGFYERHDDKGYVIIEDKRTGRKEQVDVLAVFPYESSRKRMSVIVRLSAGLLGSVGGKEEVRLYTKGADSVLLDTALLDKGSPTSSVRALEGMNATLNEWAEIALRTLIFTKRELPVALWEAWYVQYESATSSPVELAKMRKGQDNAIQRLQREIECELTIQGATAIEDKLQDGVPEILQDLRTAGIKVWMLTGDKVGTAKNIAMACNILPTDADTLEITTETFAVLDDVPTAKLAAIQKKLAEARAKLQDDMVPQVRLSTATEEPEVSTSVRAATRMVRQAGGRCARLTLWTAKLTAWFVTSIAEPFAKLVRSDKKEKELEAEVAAIIHDKTKELDAKYPGLEMVRAALIDRLDQIAKSDGSHGGCLVIDEKAIEYCGTLCQEALAAVGNAARSVVACRARKDQKAQMLHLIKHYVPASCCLAIGDGANDVAMIQAGQIGVGIIGKEGMQAVNVSDFAIGQFRFLRSLLLVHGRASYRRMALFWYYVLYKGTVEAVAFWLFSMEAQASAGNIYISIFYNWLYSIVLTILPILFVGIGDFDVPKEVGAHMPELYTAGIRRTYFTYRGFWLWTLEGLFHAGVAAYVPIWGMKPTVMENGTYFGAYFLMSWTSMHILIWGVNLRLVFEINSWTIFEHIMMWGTLVLFELCAVIMAFVFYPSSLPISFSWNEFYMFMYQTYGYATFWFVFLLGVWLFLMPRCIMKAATLLFRPLSASKRARRQIERESSTHDVRKMQRYAVERQQTDKALLRASAMMVAPGEETMKKFRDSKGSNVSKLGSPYGRSGSIFSENAATSMAMFEQSVSNLSASSGASPKKTSPAPRSSSNLASASVHAVSSVVSDSASAVGSTLGSILGSGRKDSIG